MTTIKINEQIAFLRKQKGLDLLPIMLHNNDVEFDNTLFSIWRYGYVY